MAVIVDKTQGESMASMLKKTRWGTEAANAMLLAESIGVLLKDSSLFGQTNWANRAMTLVDKECHTS